MKKRSSTPSHLNKHSASSSKSSVINGAYIFTNRKTDKSNFSIHSYQGRNKFHLIPSKIQDIVLNIAGEESPAYFDFDNLSCFSFNKNGKFTTNHRTSAHNIWTGFVDNQMSAMAEGYVKNSDLQVYVYNNADDQEDESLFRSIRRTYDIEDDYYKFTPVILIAPEGTISRAEGLKRAVENGCCAFIESGPMIENDDPINTFDIKYGNIPYIISIALDVLKALVDCERIPLLKSPKEIAPGIFVFYEIPEERLKMLLNPFPTKEEIEQDKKETKVNPAILRSEERAALPPAQIAPPRAVQAPAGSSASAAGSTHDISTIRRMSFMRTPSSTITSQSVAAPTQLPRPVIAERSETLGAVRMAGRRRLAAAPPPPAIVQAVERAPVAVSPQAAAPVIELQLPAAASSAQAVPLVETPIGTFPLRSGVPIQLNPALRAQEHTELFPALNTSAAGASTDVAPISSSTAAVEAPKRKGKGKEKATNSGSFSAGKRLSKTATFFRSLSMHRNNNNNRQLVCFTNKEERLLKKVASREATKEILDNYQSIITDHPNLFQYFRHLQICLDNVIGALKSISSGKIDASNFKKNIIDLVGQGIGLFALFLPVPPIVQAIPIILSFVIGNIEDAKIQALANKVSKFFPDTSEYGALIKILCILLTIHLRNEILDISAIAMLPGKSKELSRVDQLVATHFNNIMTFFGSIDDDATPSLATWFPSLLATFNITLDPNVKIKEGASAHDYALKVVSESASGRLSFTGTRPAAPAGPSKRSSGSQCVVS